MNFVTELKLANLNALKHFLSDNPEVNNIRKIYRPCKDVLKEVVKQKIVAWSS